MSEDSIKQPNTFAEITKIISDYTEWYSQVLRYLIYPNELDMEKLSYQKLDIFRNWIEKARDQELLNDGVFENLSVLYEDFHKMVEELITKASQNQTKLVRKDYDELTAFFEGFMIHLRRLEQDSTLKDNGIDILTGLRHKTILKSDLNKELERLARSGRTFCISLARVDGYAEMKNSASFEQAQSYTKAVAEVIKRTLRSFDDAYRLEDGLFFLTLKQTDMSGGLRALERLKEKLKKDEVKMAIGAKIEPITLSCVIAEPVAGDHVSDLLQNLKGDLGTLSEEKGAVLEYIEMSPLQRYLKADS